MECQDCGTEMRVKRTYPSGTDKIPTTSRVHECACGSRFLSEDVITRRLPPVAISSPPVARGAPVERRHTARRTPAEGSETARPCDSSIPNGGLGGSVSESGSDPIPPDPNPVLADPPIRAREPAAPRPWSPADWKRHFGAAWALKFHNGARHYGATGDGKACGALGDLLGELPESDVLAAQERAGAMFSEFFADRSKAVLDARHCFAFFVGRWGGLRLPKAAGPEADPRCDWHRDVHNDARPSRFPRAGCPRCKHFAARAGGRGSEPTPIAALMSPQLFDQRAADVERLRTEREAERQAKGGSA